MKTRVFKEIFWILGATLTTLIIGYILFDDKLFNGRLLDLQVHDTYYIFPKTFFLVLIGLTLLISIYLIRGLYWKSNKRFVNVVLTLILAIILYDLLHYASWLYGYVKDSGFYVYDEASQTEKISQFLLTYWYLTIINSILILTLTTTIYKTIKPIRTPSRDGNIN